MVVAPKLPENPHLLIDGDILAYRAAAAAEKTKYAVYAADLKAWQFFDSAKDAKAVIGTEGFDTLWSRKEVQPVETAYAILHSMWDTIAQQFPVHSYEMYLSGERNFRDLIWKTRKYKGQRREKPKHLGAVLDYIKTGFDTILAEGEADDAIVSAHYEYVPLHRSIIVSNDKDLDQASGWHFDPIKKEVYYVTQRDADLFLFQQILTGDLTDNVPGLEGWGPAKAKRHLEGTQSTQDGVERIKAAYQEESSLDYFTEQSELMYIRRDARSFKEYFNA